LADRFEGKRLNSPNDLVYHSIKGNVFLGGPGGILVLSPGGKHLGTIVTGQVTANCAFGGHGSTLYMAADHYFMRVKTKTKGEGF
jgi:gluconolactonase